MGENEDKTSYTLTVQITDNVSHEKIAQIQKKLEKIVGSISTIKIMERFAAERDQFVSPGLNLLEFLLNKSRNISKLMLDGPRGYYLQRNTTRILSSTSNLEELHIICNASTSDTSQSLDLMGLHNIVEHNSRLIKLQLEPKPDANFLTRSATLSRGGQSQLTKTINLAGTHSRIVARNKASDTYNRQSLKL